MSSDVPAVEASRDDAADLGYQVLSEEEIVALVQNECTDINQDDSDDAYKKEMGNKSTHAKAFIAFEIAVAWCEQQSECISMEILFLKRMRDLAAKKRQCSIVQRKIQDYFTK